MEINRNKEIQNIEIEIKEFSFIHFNDVYNINPGYLII
jgi:hypothetical protein